jgi:hypothetical protein
MSLHRHPISAVPAETARVAQAVFPKGNLYMTLRDKLGTLYTDEDFADLFPTCSGLRTRHLGLANTGGGGPAISANPQPGGPTLSANEPTLVCEGLANTPVGQHAVRTA